MEIPNYRESRILIKTLFDPFSLRPVDIEWLEKRNKLPKLAQIQEQPKTLIIDPVSLDEYNLWVENRYGSLKKSRASKNKSSKLSVKERRRLREEQAGDGFTNEEWVSLKSLYGDKCLRCGNTEDPIVPDHVQALYRGGRHSIDNIQPLCYRCNLWKGTKTIDFRPEQRVA